MSGVQGSNLIRRKKHRHYGVKENKNNPPSAHSKEKLFIINIFTNVAQGLKMEGEGWSTLS